MVNGSFHSRLCGRSLVAPPPCGLLLFLHIEKTGGTWVAENMKRCTSPCGLQSCDFSQGSGWQNLGGDPCLYRHVVLQHWQPLLEGELSEPTTDGPTHAHVRALRTQARRPVACWPRGGRNDSFRLPPLNASRVTIEYHANNWQHWETIAPLLHNLRALYRRSNCTFTAFTILREPKAQLLSFWNYFGHNVPLRQSAAVGAERNLRTVLGRVRQGPRWWPPGQRNLSDISAPAQCDEPKLLEAATERLRAFDVRRGTHEHIGPSVPMLDSEWAAPALLARSSASLSTSMTHCGGSRHFLAFVAFRRSASGRWIHAAPLTSSTSSRCCSDPTGASTKATAERQPPRGQPQACRSLPSVRGACCQRAPRR